MLSPHKVAVSMLLDLFVPPRSQQAQQQQMRAAIDSVLERKTEQKPALTTASRFALTQFVSRQLLNASRSPSLEELEAAFHRSCPAFVAAEDDVEDSVFEVHVRRPLADLRTIDDLENLFAEFDAMAANPHHALFSPSGLFGLHLRWLRLAHQRMSFSALARFFQAVVDYVSAYSRSTSSAAAAAAAAAAVRAIECPATDVSLLAAGVVAADCMNGGSVVAGDGVAAGAAGAAGATCSAL